MILAGVTMTTAVQVLVARDLFELNPVLQFEPTPMRPVELAGVRFWARAQAHESRPALRRRCANGALHLLLQTWPELILQLFVCHSAWQARDRVSLHRGLWKSLEHSGIRLPSGERSAETLVERDAEIKFFGSVRVPLNEIGRACEVIDTEPDSFLVAVTNGYLMAVDDDLLKRWQRNHRSSNIHWRELSQWVCLRQAICFRPFGFFDDVEGGVDLILGLGELRRNSYLDDR
jgi:hypothetical protein